MANRWTLGVDPGKRSVAWALCDGELLVRAGFVRGRTRQGLYARCVAVFLDDSFPHIDDAVFELPKVYQQRNLKGDPQDLIHLALTVGMLLPLFPNHSLVLPRDWKGTVPKKVMNNRVVKRLDRREVEVAYSATSAALRHNVLDAVGICLWRLGRM